MGCHGKERIGKSMSTYFFLPAFLFSFHLNFMLNSVCDTTGAESKG